MDIVVLDYNSTSVEIYRGIDEDYIEREYGGDVEEYLCKERGYNDGNCYWMSGGEISFTVYGGLKDKNGIKV